jgi:hypothetical protein
MRIGAQLSRFGHEGGAVAVMVAVFVTFVAMGVATLAIDGGSLWQSQRNLVTNTDAMAHAGAVRIAEYLKEFGECPTQAVREVEVAGAVETLRQRNNVADEVIKIDSDCTAASNRYTGFVHVQALQPSDSFFSGRSDLSAFGTSTFDFESRTLPVRGLAVCRQMFDVGFRDKLEIKDPTPAYGETPYVGAFAVPYWNSQDVLKELGSSCEFEPDGTPGNWGWLAEDKKNQDPACAPLPGECKGDTGTDNLKQEFEGQTGKTFRIPLYDRASKQGSNARFNIVGVAEVILLGTCDITDETEFITDEDGKKRKITLPLDVNRCGKDITDYDTNYAGKNRFLIFQLLRTAFFGTYSDLLYELPVSSCAVTTDLELCAR